eukprot:CAMPEP_0119279702 /NCGR_PEP_ID=MMETSP1329-20130426/21321_1 /TAXON_ID=114041 /ORGANISM="Genus nov. species nov., Strain RCC1024" /LENGTH=272 /DNA_ID=CAMNT_0007280259 /DNA_START=94 /DNA_END=908 /DNA_ORIENTATION=-
MRAFKAQTLAVLLATLPYTAALSIGIDLGTSNSCCAVVRPDRSIEMVPRRADGKLLTPSVVMADAEANVRLVAPDAQPREGEARIVEWKRAIGLDADQAAWHVQETTKQKLRLDDGARDPQGHVGVVAALEGGGYVRVSPQACAAAVLESLLADVEAFCGERPDKAVVGVPACFLPEQKAATEEACRALGLAKAQAAYEPELAAAVHGATKKQEGTSLALVFDLGAGTLDVSLVLVGGATAEVVATSGDLNLGGTDFTKALAEAEGLSPDEA